MINTWIALGGLLLAVIGFIAGRLDRRLASDKRIEKATLDLMEGLRKYQIGIHIPVQSDHLREQIKRNIRAILEKHFK